MSPLAAAAAAQSTLTLVLFIAARPPACQPHTGHSYFGLPDPSGVFFVISLKSGDQFSDF